MYIACTQSVCQCAHSCLTATPWTVAHQAPLSMGFPGKNTGVSCHFLSLENFPNPGIEPTSAALQVNSLLVKPFMFSISLYVYSLYIVYTANEDVLPHQKALSRHLTVHQDQIIVNAVVPQHPWEIEWFWDPLAPSCPAVHPPDQVGKCSAEVSGSLPWEVGRGKAPAWVPPGFPMRCFFVWA